MSTPDSTSARAPSIPHDWRIDPLDDGWFVARCSCGWASQEYTADAAGRDGWQHAIEVAPATPPSDETPFIVDNTLGQVRVAGSTVCECGHRAGDHDDTNAEGQADGILGQCFECNCAIFRLPAPRTPSVDAEGPTAPERMDAQFVRTIMRLYKTEGRDDFHRAVGEAIRDLKAARSALPPVDGPQLIRSATPPSPEGTGTPPTPSELPSQPELGVGVAGELPGVGEYEGAQALTSVFAFAKRECYSDEEEIVDVAERYVAGLRLRAEAAERQLGTFTQADIDALNLYVAVGVAVCAASGGTSHGIFSGGWAQEQADSLIARIAATLSSQRTL